MGEVRLCLSKTVSFTTDEHVFHSGSRTQIFIRGKRESNVVWCLLRPRQCQAESPDHLEEKDCLITQHYGYISLTAVTQTLLIFFIYFT